jgi:hypothetical protein
MRISPIRNDKGTANIFAGHLEKAFKSNELPENEAFEAEINKTLEEPLQITQPVYFLAPKESQNIIQGDLDPRKAPGCDLITGRILKQMPRRSTVRLTSICKSSIRRGYFPAQWEVAQIIMIFKPGKPLEAVGSYRPISLLPTMSKILEKALIKRLCPIL